MWGQARRRKNEHLKVEEAPVPSWEVGGCRYAGKLWVFTSAGRSPSRLALWPSLHLFPASGMSSTGLGHLSSARLHLRGVWKALGKLGCCGDAPRRWPARSEDGWSYQSWCYF